MNRLLMIHTLVLLVLLGCGGGDPEDNQSGPKTSIQPVGCIAAPAQCQ